MRLFKAIRFNGISLNFRLDSAETQPLMDPNRERKFNQFLAAVVANIIGISWGTCIGWSSPAIAKMTDDLSNSPLDFVPSADQLSWIGGFLPVGGLFGPIFFAPLPGLIGRKLSLLVNALFFIASFLILIFTHDITSIYIARFLQGFGSGVVMVILPMYTGEIASAKCRGVLSSFIQIGLVIGILYAYCIGPYVSYTLFQVLCLIIPVIFIALFAFMPDTPHYYISNGYRHKATKALKFLRGKSAEGVAEELNEIQESVVEAMSHRAGVFDVFKGKANVLALTIGVGLICFQNTSGIDAVLFYSETIFTKAGSSINSAVATIIIGAVMLLSSCITPFFVDSTGRKGLLLTSAAGMTVSLTTMGVYFFLDERGSMTDYGWVPVTALVGFILFYCVGFGPLPFTVLSEMFAPEIKSMASVIAVSACWIVDFAVTKAFLPLETIIGAYGNFWLFGFFCVIAFVFTLTMVFETKGLSLNEIQDRLKRRKSVARC